MEASNIKVMREALTQQSVHDADTAAWILDKNQEDVCEERMPWSKLCDMAYNLAAGFNTLRNAINVALHINVALAAPPRNCDEEPAEEQAARLDGMTFGMAIEAMKQGKKVARKGWNGKGMWLCIPLCDGPKEIPATGIWGKPNAEYAEQNGGTVKVVPYITMKAADGTIVMGWLASQTDMLSDDWQIVD